MHDKPYSQSVVQFTVKHGQNTQPMHNHSSANMQMLINLEHANLVSSVVHTYNYTALYVFSSVRLYIYIYIYIYIYLHVFQSLIREPGHIVHIWSYFAILKVEKCRQSRDKPYSQSVVQFTVKHG